MSIGLVKAAQPAPDGIGAKLKAAAEAVFERSFGLATTDQGAAVRPVAECSANGCFFNVVYPDRCSQLRADAIFSSRRSPIISQWPGSVTRTPPIKQGTSQAVSVTWALFITPDQIPRARQGHSGPAGSASTSARRSVLCAQAFTDPAKTAGDQMNKRGYWLCSIAVVVLLGGLARPAHAGKQFNYAMGAACQPAGLLSAVSPLTYTNSGFMIQSLTLDRRDLSGRLGEAGRPDRADRGRARHRGRLASCRSAYRHRPNACSLSYQSAGGSLTMQPLPIPYPVPANMRNMAYGARGLHRAALDGHSGDFLQHVRDDPDQSSRRALLRSSIAAEASKSRNFT